MNEYEKRLFMMCCDILFSHTINGRFFYIESQSINGSETLQKVFVNIFI